ncbi:MAG: hypothetical protein ABW185_02225 [Sedimenticola sp.]
MKVEVQEPMTDRCKEQDLYMGDSTVPIYQRGLKNGIPTKDILHTMLTINNEAPNVCSHIPIGVNQNAIFIINTDKLGHPKDILADGCGTWNQTCTKNKYFFRNNTNYVEIPQSGYGTDGLIKVKRMSYRHSTSPDLHCVIIYITLHSGVGVAEYGHNIALLQYFYEIHFYEMEEHSVQVPAHKSSKTGLPFHRTFESTKIAIKSTISGNQKSSPCDIVHNILDKKGGLENIRAPGEHVRSRRQVSDYVYLSKPEASDPLAEVMELCKVQSLHPSTAYVREVTGSPEMSIFMATDQQLLDVKRFCTNPKYFCVLGVDATFNIGDYYLTLTTFRNLMLSTKKGISPVFLGPALIHQRRLFDSYFSLPSTMLKYCPDLQRLIVYGSDGEKNITDSFDTCFPFSKHLLCDIHMKDNIVKKLTDLHIVGDPATSYMSDIFENKLGH